MQRSEEDGEIREETEKVLFNLTREVQRLPPGSSKQPRSLGSGLIPSPLSSLSFLRDSFLRILAAQQWQRKRKTKDLSEIKLPSLDDAVTSTLEGTADEGAAEVPSRHGKASHYSQRAAHSLLMYTWFCYCVMVLMLLL